MNQCALTKIQIVILIAVIVVAVIAGAIAYSLNAGKNQSAATIKIGVCADLDMSGGRHTWQGIVLAAEQVNAEGGILGRKIEIIAEDDDSESGSNDLAFATSAFTKLLEADDVDLIIAQGSFATTVHQDLAFQSKKIFIQNGGTATSEALTQRVLDDYDTCKYYFRAGITNTSASVHGTVISIADCSSYTGFKKIGMLYHAIMGVSGFMEPTLISLEEDYGLDVVYTESIPMSTTDFGSYFAKAEAAGAEILYSFIMGQAGISFVKEYYDRQSPTVIWGIVGGISSPDAWEVTEGKCEHVSTVVYPVVAGYPLTSKSVSTSETYADRWNEQITTAGANAYDIMRFILPDAVRRAGMFETEALIKALETTSIETSSAVSFRFTSSHDVYVAAGDPNDPERDTRVCMFQWQNGEFAIVWPKKLMEEAGGAYTHPSWTGPWD